MSHLLINQFLNELDRLRTVSGTSRETVVREAFKDLLKAWAKSHDLVFIPEYDFRTPAKEYRQVDGALLYSLRVPFGYWEAKDEKDDLDEEIATKFRRGYPQTNIIFEDSRTAVLIQDRREATRCSVEDTPALKRLLDLYFGYERPEIAEFREAVEQFKTDLPDVLDALREKIDGSAKSNAGFRAEELKFLQHAQETINPAVTPADVREMLIQHILTEEIFSKVYDDDQFHRENNIAKELYALEAKFFTGGAKKQTLKQLEPYYAAIRSAAAQISSHAEKQTFLKVIYENFYKVYNPKAADRLGVIYTPNEIVRFMIESADWLCERNFGKNLIDKGVEILDPATGTGTFICEMLEHFRGQKKKLEYKYKEELHANEVAILPYYVANLNIEATYASITEQYVEYPNLCFVDTLDNIAGLGKFSGHQEELFGAMSEENVERIKRQNRRKISVIIGNPPYNANQQNENDFNKNREYMRVDQRIKDTYIRESTAQKTKLYDMYARFFRWTSDRIKDEGIIAFVSNRSFIDSRSFDGFRKTVARDFKEVWIVDLGGDVRANPKLSGTKNNVFGIQTGVAISFLVKDKELRQPTRIFYARRPEMETAEDKLSFLSTARLAKLEVELLKPDANQNWINIFDSDFDTHIAIEQREKEVGIFDQIVIGVSTNRDDWVTDFDSEKLLKKIRFFQNYYNCLIESLKPNVRKLADLENVIRDDKTIKWSETLKRHVLSRDRMSARKSDVRELLYRPFTCVAYHVNKLLSDRLTINHAHQFGPSFDYENNLIAFSGVEATKSFQVLASKRLVSLDCLEKTHTASRYWYTTDGNRTDNISDLALEHFRERYRIEGKGKTVRTVTKDAIFAYVYAVLHDPIYRETYSLNLKREFPRVPLYDNFSQWVSWGEELMKLHTSYSVVRPWALKRIYRPDKESREAGLDPKAILRANKEDGLIIIDSETQLSSIPEEAWNYRLGNRSALEWILDQYKEKAPKDPMIRAKFNTYRFADYKEKVIDLLTRVTRVSVETQAIVEAMRSKPR